MDHGARGRVSDSADTVTMTDQRFIVDLDTLGAQLDVWEGAQEVQYTFTLAQDRSICLITRETIKNGEAQSHEEWERTLAEAKDDTATFSPVVIWILRGMWGIPLGV